MVPGAWPMVLDQVARAYDEPTLSRVVEYRHVLWAGADLRRDARRELGARIVWRAGT